MPPTRCPKCNADIGVDSLNVKEGVGVCRACGVVWKLSEIASSPEDAQADSLAVQEVPDGCWVNDLGDRTIVGSNCRSGIGCFFAFFAAFWNSITGLFVTVALGGLYTNLVGPLPAWYSWTNIKFSGPGHSGTVGTMTMNATIGLCLFLIPFVLVGIATACLAILGVFGRVEISLHGDEGTVFTGVGVLGWKRKFSVTQVKSVRITDSGTTSNGKSVKHVEIAADTKRSFGVFLSDTRKMWMCGVLRRLLIPAG
ncbi:MAG: hypothetical protein AABZ53_12330 [Planctomycetota bacterium]